MIGIVNLGLGNLGSVANAIYSLGYDYTVIEQQKHFAEVTHLIIPGVGSYSAAMASNNTQEFKEMIRNFVDSKRPVLGICLGMQLMSDFGEEGGITKGMGFIPGHVQRFSKNMGLPLPHVGWNTVKFTIEHPVFNKVKNRVDFYFVHSYYFACDNSDNVLGITEYNKEFPAIVGKENLLGFQFHPEKSQANGLKLLENFCEWDGKW